MRFIDINKLKLTSDAIGWEVTRQGHLDAMQPMNAKERKAYIKANPSWNDFQPAMMALSNNKCWYSEGPIGNNDFNVDHFRPKNKAVYALDYKDPNSKIIVSKTNGYWWKAYDWDNFRLIGSLSNIRRKDRLNPKNGVKGKGNYFPLDLTNGGRIATDEENLSCEIPLLLDPTHQHDVSLLTFDANGEAISAGENDNEDMRVLQSIFYYHLDLEQLNRERKIAWDDCANEINYAKDAIDNAPNEAAKRAMLNQCYSKLKDYVSNPDRSYLAVSKACIMVYSELNGYNWLKRFVRSRLI
jgi:hypothetical protein